MLELRSVSKEFINNRNEHVKAIDDISLKVEKGEFVSFVGPSGSGKSTLLFVTGALLRPSQGEVLLHGENIYDTAAVYRSELRLRNIGFVFQTFNLIPYLSALDNVAVPAMLMTRSKRDAADKAADLLKRFGLAKRLDHKFSELSVGERQRVALCRSVINDPEMILADEPTGNLDPGMTNEVMALLRELNSRGQTIIVVTHEEEVASFAGRTLHLKDGRLQNGSPH
ncbi:MAG: ABC transporter ATP-binding protein [Nitrospirota bacterium]|nr:MAG: ABC transporter ATP-binding protein [Nitrospirota bacterium]